MDEQYRCERCPKLATEVHHIKPIQTTEGWCLILDYNNLLAVCVDCLNKEHNRFQRKKVIKYGVIINLLKINLYFTLHLTLSNKMIKLNYGG